MYVPITTFNIGYPVERPWKRLPQYYSTDLRNCKGCFYFSSKLFSSNALALIQAHLVSDHRYKLRIRGFSPQVMDGVTKIAVQGENIVYSLIIAHRKPIYPINNHFTIVKKKAINFGEIILYL